jgi:large subunit ribosomal protein L10
MPSVINQMLLQEVQIQVDGSSSILLIDPVGLKADESLKLRQDLRQVGAQMKVCKANLVKQALPEGSTDALAGKGSLGVVTGEDIGAAAKIVCDLAKAERLAVRGAVMEGQALDSAQATALADLPSKEQLHGMLVNVLAAPLSGFVRVLNEVPASLARVVNAIKEKQGD